MSDPTTLLMFLISKIAILETKKMGMRFTRAERFSTPWQCCATVRSASVSGVEPRAGVWKACLAVARLSRGARVRLCWGPVPPWSLHPEMGHEGPQNEGTRCFLVEIGGVAFCSPTKQGSLQYTPEHCLVNGGFPLSWWKKPCFKWAKCIF